MLSCKERIKKRMMSMVAVVLVISMLIQTIPQGYIIGSATEISPDGYDALDVRQETEESSYIISEDVDLRETNVKHFRLANGNYIAAEYPTSVHYEKNGEMVDIDNTLVYDSITNTYSPADSPIDVAFAATAGNSASAETFTVNNTAIAHTDELVTYNSGEYSMTSSLVLGQTSSNLEVMSAAEETAVGGEAQSVETTADAEMTDEITPVSISETNLSVDNSSSDEELQGDDEFLVLNNLTSKACYDDILPNVAFEYVVMPDGVKENIILKNASALRTFRFAYNIGDLTAVQEDNQTIVMKNSDGEEIYRISAPVMNDSADETSTALTFTIISSSNGTLIAELSADDEWLDDESRVYPVTLDPYTNIRQDSGISNHGVYYQNTNATAAYGSYHVGNCAAYNVCRSFMKFDMPTFNKGDMIVDAVFYARQNSSIGYSADVSGSSLQVNISEINSVVWSGDSSVQYNDQEKWTRFKTTSNPAYSGEIVDYVITNSSNNGSWLSWNITSLVKGWYSGRKTNNGLALWSAEESSRKIAVFYAPMYGSVTSHPILQITYLNNKGLESRWTTHEHSAGTAGTGYVNDYTGNLVFISPLMSTTGNNMPLSMSLVYNGYHSETQSSGATNVGNGWRLNIVTPHISVVTDSAISADFPYCYTDSDGTEHYFKHGENSTFIDEEGLNLTLEIVNSGETKYVLTSSDGTKLKFTESGYVYIVESADGIKNQVFHYSRANVSWCTDGSGRRIDAAYDSNGKLSTLTDPAGRSVSFTYTGNSLTRITYPDGTYSSFTYDSENRLTSAVSADGSKIGYTYYGTVTSSDASEKNRVKIVSEYGKNGADGNKVKFEYRDDNTTKFTDYTGNQDGIYELYQFDDYGRTVSVIDSIGGASSYSYTAPSSGKAQNRLMAASSTSRPVENLLLNHNFENLDDTSWEFMHDYDDVSEFYRPERYLGYYSVRLSNNNYNKSKISQYINRAISGKLTFSAYIKTDNIIPKDNDRTNGGVALLIDFYNSAGTKLGDTRFSEFITGTNEWSRYALTAEAPSGTAKARVYVLLKNATGTAYVDCTQAEFNAGASQYNMLENSSFTNGATGWGGSNLTSSDTVVNGKYKIFGGATVSKNIHQTVTVVRPASKCGISVSGKATGKSVDIKGDRLFALIISYKFSDGTHENKVVPFNPDTFGEQFTSKALYPSSANLSKTVSFITLYVGYYQNANSVQFDDLQLIFDETGTSYTYDANGNLINAIDNGQRNSTYNFSNANELTSATNPDNTNYTYKYGENNLKHRLLSARSTNMKLEFAFSYDSNGNVTKMEMYNNVTPGVRPTTTRSIYTETTYTTDGNYVASQTDDHGRTISTNVYDTPVDGKINKGTLLQNTDGNGNITKYSYNAANDRLTETKAVDKNDDSVELAKNTYTYDNEKLTGITAGVGSDTVNYTFAYDTYGNQQNVKVGTQSLITNTYAERNGVLASSLYGNSDTVTYTYDGYDRIKTIKYNGDTENRFEYYYNAEGKLARTVDNENGVMYTYLYDVIGRPVSCTGSDGTKISYAFDNFNKSTRTQYYWDGVRKTTAFAYDSSKDNALKTTTFSNGSTLTNNIDGFGRVNIKTLNVGSNSFTHYLNFVHLSETRTSNEVARLYYRKGEDEYLSVLDYKYDVNGNITKIYDRPFTSHWPTDSDTPTVSYEYDQLNQLTHEVNGYTGETVSYTYDNRGNILTKTVVKDGETNTINYTYGDSNWKDKLTAYDGKTITYDEIGNPLTYDDWTFDWQKGRQLASMSNSDTTLSFKYNDSGIRTSKTVNGTETKYLLDGSTIVAQKTGDTILWFYYDGAGQLTAMQNGSDGEYYYYVYNHQGDVVALLDSSLNYVANYTYDSWGKVVSITGSNTTIGNLNPFRYRGYYYDSETGLYYLNSRYYNPEIGRFINADNTDYLGAGGSSLSYNLFAYCMNDPVNRFDDGGNWSLPNWAKVTIGAVATVAAVAVTVATGGAAAPVLIGVAASTVGGAATGAIKHRVTTGSWSGAGKAALDGAADGFMTGGLCAFGGSVIGGAARTIKNAKSGITIGKVGQFEDVAEIAKVRHYSGLKEFKLIEKTLGTKTAEAVGWWQNKCVVKGVMALKGAIYDCGGALTGAYAKEVALTKGYKYLYNVWLM